VLFRSLSELSGAERGAATDELAAAVADGRLSMTTAQGWPAARELALSALLLEGQKIVQIDSGWRDRLAGSFAALQGNHREARRGGLDASDEALDRTQLQVRLNVPPALEVEPVGAAFEKQARALEALTAALTTENLTGLKAFTVDGKRAPDTVTNEVKRLVPLLDGLAVLARPEATQVEGKNVAEARRFVATWRSEAGLTRDVRATFASPWANGSERAHAAIVGVSRRELRVAFVSTVKPTLTTPAPGFVLNTAVEQRYLVPVLVTGGAFVPHTTRAAERSSLKAVVDEAQRSLSKLDAVVQDSLHREVRSGVSQPEGSTSQGNQ
jgi:hypothetical protein